MFVCNSDRKLRIANVFVARWQMADGIWLLQMAFGTVDRNGQPHISVNLEDDHMCLLWCVVWRLGIVILVLTFIVKLYGFRLVF